MKLKFFGSLLLFAGILFLSFWLLYFLALPYSPNFQSLTPLAWDMILWMPLANHDHFILSFQGPIYGHPPFLIYFIGASGIFSIGFVCLVGNCKRSMICSYDRLGSSFWGSAIRTRADIRLLASVGAYLWNSYLCARPYGFGKAIKEVS